MLKHVRSGADWNQKNLGQKGFTLIELLVVIIILGILAAVVVLAINGFTERGEANACKTERRTVQSAVAAYYAEFDDWPADVAALSDYFEEEPSNSFTIEDGVVSTCPS